MADYVSGADLASTRFPPGTSSWNEALQNDLSQGYLTKSQYDYALANPGAAIPISAGAPSTGGGLGGIISTIGDAAENLLMFYSKKTQMEYERDLLQDDLARRKAQLQTGLQAPMGFGGINVWTLVGVGGLVLAAIFLLKEK